jgi:hypothetical protein
MVAINTLVVLASLCVAHVQGFSRRLDVATTCASQVRFAQLRKHAPALRCCCTITLLETLIKAHYY